MSDDQQFDLVVANMVFMDTPDLESTVSAIDRLVVPGGTVVISVLHPCHWPYYWGYAYEDWFEYPKEVAIEATFRITKAISEVETFHFHRPLERYSDVLCNRGFLIERFVELMPSAKVARQYGTTPARFPRFLAVLASKPELRD
jgi:SAM-dependent methyltransferase